MGAARQARRAVLLAPLLALGLWPAVSTAGAAPDRTAATGACAPVQGGAASSGGGPARATVVVDTGAGPVWSACVSFTGTISGIEALDLARSTITDLAPVYESFSGQGRAVCALRGVGASPPGCLGAQAEYWAYFRNGAYARGGASSSKVRDGDTEGWRWGTGAGPRTPTVGTRAVAAPPATTAPPPTAPPPTAPPPTAAPAPTVGPAGGSSGGPAGLGTQASLGAGVTVASDAGATTVPAGGPTTTADAALSTTTVAPTGSSSTSSVSMSEGSSGAAAASGSSATASSKGGVGDRRGPSSRASVIGFGIAVAALALAGLAARRRRRPAT